MSPEDQPAWFHALRLAGLVALFALGMWMVNHYDKPPMIRENIPYGFDGLPLSPPGH